MIPIITGAHKTSTGSTRYELLVGKYTVEALHSPKGVSVIYIQRVDATTQVSKNAKLWAEIQTTVAETLTKMKAM